MPERLPFTTEQRLKVARMATDVMIAVITQNPKQDYWSLFHTSVTEHSPEKASDIFSEMFCHIEYMVTKHKEKF